MLEQLLTRVQERAAMPRSVARASAAEDTLEEPVETAAALALDEPLADETGLSEPEMDELDDLDEVDDIEVEVDELDEVEIDEQPESGPISAGTMDDAIDAAEHHPPMTPPPESGEGVTSPHIAPRDEPTMEQLGQTISLDEGSRQDFELDEPTLDEPRPEEAPTHMEAHLPTSVAPRSADLQAPENAREELDRHRLGDSTPIQARVSARPVLSTNVVEFATASRSFEPKTFLELVEASLTLK